MTHTHTYYDTLAHVTDNVTVSKLHRKSSTRGTGGNISIKFEILRRSVSELETIHHKRMHRRAATINAAPKGGNKSVITHSVKGRV